MLASTACPHLPLLGKVSPARRAQLEPEHRVSRSFPPRGHAAMARKWERNCGSWRRRRAVRSSGKRGQHRVGWYACPRLTLFATEWSAARRKPLRAAAMHISATISADVKARRLPTSGRRKFPSGNFRSARDFEGAKRVSRGQAYQPTQTSPFSRRPHRTRLRHRNPGGPSPFARNRGMSPLPPCVVQARQHHHDQHRRDVESRAGCEVHVLDVNA